MLKHALRHWSPRQGTQQRPLLTHFHRVVRASSTLPVWPAINAVELRKTACRGGEGYRGWYDDANYGRS